MKRFLVLFLALTMAAALFASGGQPQTAGGAGQRVTIQIPVYDRAFQGWNVTDNYWTRWMQSEFGDKNNVTVQYVAIGRSTERQDYLQMLAAGRAPHIIFHYDMPIAVEYYGQGVMQQLNYNEISANAPTFWAKTRNMIE
jgi:putative aldouronate transport system substrate-binding protein